MYQGNTQVDHSLMERVLEVADMLEVKGLSRIRSNISIKKFMGTAASPNTNSKTSPLNVPCTDNPRGSTKSPEDQFYCGKPSRYQNHRYREHTNEVESSACDSREPETHNTCQEMDHLFLIHNLYCIPHNMKLNLKMMMI
nr:uncharacterized protein LOC128705376 [Cherax quadricarinatus]